VLYVENNAGVNYTHVTVGNYPSDCREKFMLYGCLESMLYSTLYCIRTEKWSAINVTDNSDCISHFSLPHTGV